MIDDAETKAMLEVAWREAPYAFFKQTGLVAMGGDVPLRPEIEEWLQGRVEWIRAGVERCPGWFRKTLIRFDPDLRVRWDTYAEHWVIELRSPTDNLYHRCGTWAKPLGPALIDELRKADMWRTSTAEKIAAAEAQAEAQRKKNDQASVDGYLERLDGMTKKKLGEFIEVAQALEHGETLTFAGDDAKLMNQIWEEKQKQPDLPETAINPGMKPGIFHKE